jgi:hypothetical protein
MLSSSETDLNIRTRQGHGLAMQCVQSDNDMPGKSFTHLTNELRLIDSTGAYNDKVYTGGKIRFDRFRTSYAAP